MFQLSQLHKWLCLVKKGSRSVILGPDLTLKVNPRFKGTSSATRKQIPSVPRSGHLDNELQQLPQIAGSVDEWLQILTYQLLLFVMSYPKYFYEFQNYLLQTIK